ncbi:RNA polymerase sigma factor [Dyadobacter aurulentus]|uniref:RNA polymerase sigma factor n=1 Tax=Dyadobacter sp. UC 10 TaxID=2605428 RepID=UPI001788DC60|nr:sigma-70 family RNA polymerase sigma factor [Dyadobacter sp. UC 10]
MSRNSDDSFLWVQMMAGDDKALGELMRGYYKTMINYGYKFIKNDEFIKDCIQDVFVDIWNAHGRLTLPTSIKAYLFICLKRKIERNLSHEPHLKEIEDQNQLFVTFSPEWWLIEEESVNIRARRIAEILNALPKRQREVVYLKFFEELSRDEISEVLAITPQSVSNLLQLAFTQMRKQWKFSTISFLFVFMSPFVSF